MNAKYFWLVLSVIGSTGAAASSLESQIKKASECSAIFFILSANPNTSLSQTYTQKAIFSGQVLGAYLSSQSDTKIKMGEMLSIRDRRAIQIGKEWDANKEGVLNSLYSCEGWANKALEIVKTQANNPMPLLLSLPAEIAPTGNKQQLDTAFAEAMKAWDKMDRMTPNDLKERLKRETTN